MQGQMSKIVRLDLSDNLLTRVEGAGVAECARLDWLDLSHNRICSTVRIYEVLGNIRHLLLRHNQLAYTTGLERLYALETLDLSHNVVSSFAEVQRLQSLPCLRLLVLADNPVYLLDDYRALVAGFFLTTHPQVLCASIVLFERIMNVSPNAFAYVLSVRAYVRMGACAHERASLSFVCSLC